MTTVITLTIGGKQYPIDPRDIAFFQVEGGSPDCMSGIAAGGVGPFFKNNEWLVSFELLSYYSLCIRRAAPTDRDSLQVGDVFLKNIYFSTDDQKNVVTIAKQTSS